MTVPQVAEDPAKLSQISYDSLFSHQLIAAALLQDQVVKVSGIEPGQADQLISQVARHFDLQSSLELQAGVADLFGHREKLSRYYMTVNKRRDYQCITPHAEGSSFQNIQLVSFYCYHNTTDGGYTVLMNVDEAAAVRWAALREVSLRGDLRGRELTAAEASEIRMRYQVDLPADKLQPQDQVLSRKASHMAGLDICDVLALPRPTYSKLLMREIYAYWSSISRFDSDSVRDFKALLRHQGLYITPPGDPAAVGYDDGFSDKKIWSSGLRYQQIFKNQLTLNLQPGDFIVMNNLTWAHGVSNWTPGSGQRLVAAAMA